MVIERDKASEICYDLWKSRAVRGCLGSSIAHCMAIGLLMAMSPISSEPETIIELHATHQDVEAPIILDQQLPEMTVEEQIAAELLGTSGAAPIQVQNPFATIVAGVGEQGTDSQGTGAHGGGGTEFFGVSSEGDRFVYIVDVSVSMNARKLRRAINELCRSVDQFSDDQYFYVLLFSTETRLMLDEGSPEWRLATAENRKRLREWLDGVVPAGGSLPQEALALANKLRPSAIFLLSDGRFNVDLLDGKQFVAPIHTIMLEDRSRARKMLLLAEQSGGTTQYVPGPRDDYLTIRKIVGVDEDELNALELLRVGDRAIDLRRPGRPSARHYYSSLLKRFPHSKAALFARRRLTSDWVAIEDDD